jgi:hypothetical protein
VPVEKYRSIEEMPQPWRDPGDPGNLRRVAMMMVFHLSLGSRPEPGVRRFRSIEEANADRNDPLRQAPVGGTGSRDSSE